MDLAACPRCGSLDLRVPTIQDGLWPGGGETNFSVCADCAYRGAPLLFEAEGDYLAFRDALMPADPAVAPPEARQRAMPAFVAAVAVVIALAALAAGVAAASDSAAETWGTLAAALGALLGVMVGVALLRIAYRAWRPAG